MKITDIETFIIGNPWKNWVFLRLHTDAGIHGVGEATVHARAKAVEACLLELRRYYIGQDPFQIERVWEEMYRLGRPGSVHTTAMSGVEIACWDIIGKSLGVPIYQLLGGAYRDKVRVYANGWYQGPREPETFAEKAGKVIQRGYTALKFDPFGDAFRFISHEELEKSIEIVAAVRDVVGPKVDVLIEGHGRFEPATAINVAKRLEPYEPRWFEEPVRSHLMDALARVYPKVNVPIATGEGLCSKYEYVELFQRKIADVAQPDILHVGGILETKKICGMAEAFQVPVAPHNAQGPVSTAICLQVAACTPNFFIQEVFEDFNVSWTDQIVDNSPKVENGYILISDRPGLGIELNDQEMKKHPYDGDHFLSLYEPGWERRERY